MVALFDSVAQDESRGMVSQKLYGSLKSSGLKGTPSLPPKKDLMVDHGRRLYIEALVGKWQFHEIENLCRIDWVIQRSTH